MPLQIAWNGIAKMQAEPQARPRRTQGSCSGRHFTG
mgnify:CR=1 FL=1